MDRLGWSRGGHLLSELLLCRLHHRNALGYLICLAAELIKGHSELFDAASQKGDVNRHRFELLLHFC
jgi:hypothetical protein